MSKYDIYVGFEFEIEDSGYNGISELMKNAKHLIGDIREIAPYHNTLYKTAESLWRIEQDESLDTGAEFISPPQKMEQSFKTMKKFFEYVKTTDGCVTYDSCGCHVGMSLLYNGRIINVDSDEILSNLNYSLLCSLWPNRLKSRNCFCKYINSTMKSVIDRQFYNKKSFGDTLFGINHGFIVKKESSWNKKGHYYELRFPGGQDYHLHPEKIEATVRHFSDVLIKSRSARKSKKVNKRIASYINRINDPEKDQLEVYFCPKTPKEIEKEIQLTKKHINDEKMHPLFRYSIIDLLENMRKQTARLVPIGAPPFLGNAVNRSIKNRMEEQVNIYNKSYIKYYFFKYLSKHEPFMLDISSDDMYGYSTLSQSIKECRIKLTIPYDECDTDKLIFSRIYSRLSNTDKDIIRGSIKSVSAKKMFCKMIADKSYSEKILTNQKGI